MQLNWGNKDVDAKRRYYKLVTAGPSLSGGKETRNESCSSETRIEPTPVTWLRREIIFITGLRPAQVN